MAVLSSALRNQLSGTVDDARVAAEAGARQALETLGVHQREGYGSKSAPETLLRNRLRAHGRQLGDIRNKTNGTQSIARLTHEVAYEHWHRMLFARFLAENGLLIEPTSGVAVTMEECEELARDRGEDSWALAASFAQGMLPRIFRPDDAALALVLPPETRQVLQKLLSDLPAAVFIADDALGWTYQFWQAAEKKAVDARVKSGEKITGETLPAVTQLFTEPYMVQFLLHNTIGAWHAGKTLGRGQCEAATSEHELRDAVRLHSLGGYDFEYLRFVRESAEGDLASGKSGRWQPAAGVFEGWPKTVAELTVLDPCCGSGHFLVATFDLLVRLRIEVENLEVKDAVRAVIRENVFGLELDARCTQIAAFNLALAAWRLTGSPIELPPMRIACSGIGPQAAKEEWLALAEGAGEMWGELPGGERDRIRNALRHLHEVFRAAPELGSLIDPADEFGSLLGADFGAVRPFLQAAFEAETLDDERRERAVAAKGMADAAEILVGPHGAMGQGYSLVVTNVPFLARAKQSSALMAWADRSAADARADLATMLLRRTLSLAHSQGSVAVVTPQNWYFLGTYRGLRQRLLRDCRIDMLVRLGPNAFRDMNWWAATTALSVVTKVVAAEDSHFAAIDTSAVKEIEDKVLLLRGDGVSLVQQKTRLQVPDQRFSFDASHGLTLLDAYANAYQGVKTGDDDQLRRCFWELASACEPWTLYQTTVAASTVTGGLHYRLDARENRWARVQGKGAWGRAGVAISQMNALPVAMYSSERFDSNMSPIIPRDLSHLPAIWCFCLSPDFAAAVRRIDQKTGVTNATLVKVPFDLAHWQHVAEGKYPTGLPEPESDDPTQWIFHGHPAYAAPSTALQVGVARLLGYRWPPELDPAMRLSAEARKRVEACAGLQSFSDDDGVVCLSSVRGEGSASDRLRSLLVAAFGSRWSAAKELDLLQAAAERFEKKAKVSGGLDDWLRDRFFSEHCALFHKRPFVWHIWDGRRDGFHALVNYHKLAGPAGQGLRTLNAVAFTYLGWWIDRQRDDQKAGVEGADARLAAAIALQDKLRRIIEGEPPCDIFVRWKPLAEQPLGWSPDINDGVRLNIRPFVLAADVGAKNAGLLRCKIDDTWSNAKKPGVRDRGNDREKQRPRDEYPWFWGCQPEQLLEHRANFGAPTPGAIAASTRFDGTRWNGLHYSRAAKEAARRRREEDHK